MKRLKNGTRVWVIFKDDAGLPQVWAGKVRQEFRTGNKWRVDVDGGMTENMDFHRTEIHTERREAVSRLIMDASGVILDYAQLIKEYEYQNLHGAEGHYQSE